MNASSLRVQIIISQFSTGVSRDTAAPNRPQLDLINSRTCCGLLGQIVFLKLSFLYKQKELPRKQITQNLATFPVFLFILETTHPNLLDFHFYPRESLFDPKTGWLHTKRIAPSSHSATSLWLRQLLLCVSPKRIILYGGEKTLLASRHS